jgi:ferrous iron transport protein B
VGLDPKALECELGVLVVETVAVRRRGVQQLQTALDDMLSAPFCGVHEHVKSDLIHVQRRAREIAAAAVLSESPVRRWTHRLDAVLLHPVLGPIILAGVMFVMFQAVFAWSQVPVAWIASGVASLSGVATSVLPAGLFRSMIVDGAIAGVGAVITFLPQILILFFFILLLEASGYMVRAAFLMDKVMHGAGLSGRAFIPLLSSFACAVPGIMATRTIDNEKDRLTTILVAPLMTCSARLPVYTLIIAAFIPNRTLGLGIGLQGVVMFGLYIVGVAGALLAAFAIRRGVLKGASGGFMMELPKYQWPMPKDVLIGLITRAKIFLKRAGTIILGTTIVLWALASIPQAGPGQKQSQVSIAGHIATGIETVVKPIGFNHDIALALLPAMAAREVAISAIATVYSLDAGDDASANTTLLEKLRHRWPLPTALAFLAWFVFAPQCISTIAVTRRETNGWKWPLFMVGYLFALAYVAAGITYWTAVALGL